MYYNIICFSQDGSPMALSYENCLGHDGLPFIFCSLIFLCVDVSFYYYWGFNNYFLFLYDISVILFLSETVVIFTITRILVSF